MADPNFYRELASGIIPERIAKFHPLTVWLALAWMRLMAMIAAGWRTTPQLALVGMFAFIGSLGAIPAALAFRVFVGLIPRAVGPALSCYN